ncbi:MAG: adenylate/guanylate cyclase domain-containing protein [Cereibacter sphaeroides]|uniref:Adenylate/guanylate cyclase domain-containing protein n=1 Tax=Cereibacter sphaeroides TaxID=1063 RepID=A0A2W5SLG3_CERSP|nr:MAG: adenylate/guanylate cyclase domain-containing protein [Cereibacter sphaeroides]
MRKAFFAIGFVLLAALTVLRALDPYPVQAVRELYFDSLQRLSPRAQADLPVRVVDIDEASLQSIGQWPWSRDRLGMLVDRMTGYGAAAIVFDVLFPEADRLSPANLAGDLQSLGVLAPGVTASELAPLDNDLRFARAIAAGPVVLGTANSTDKSAGAIKSLAGFVEVGNAPSVGLLPVEAAVPILAPLRDAASGIGVINISPFEEATVVRRIPLIWQGQEGLLPSLSIEGLRVATGESTIVLVGEPDLEGFMQSVRLSGFDIPTTPDGQMWVRYRPDTPDLYVSARDVLAEGDNPAVRAKLEGNIVFIGTSAAGLLDIRTTALGQNVPGVSIHAQLLEQILQGDFLRRDGAVQAAEVLVFLAIGLIVVGVMSVSGPVASIFAGLSAAAVIAGASWIAFRDKGILFDATFPLFGGFLTFAAVSAYQFVIADRDKRMIRRSFSHYVAPSVLGQIERSGHKLELGGVMQPVTVMFSDIRGFTPLSETMTATELVEVLNRLFTELGDEILLHQGTIDKFIGDAIMAFWNAPLEMADHPSRAAAAALGMRLALQRFNAAKGAPLPVAVALGVATGTVCVGNIGSRDRFNYTVVGETVNQAARIEAGCRAVDYDILVSRDTALGASDMAFLDAGRLTLKGVSERISASILVGGPEMAKTPEFQALLKAHEALIAAVGSGQETSEMLADCRARGVALEPGLHTFYDKMLQRRGDFASQASTHQTAMPR